VFIPIGGVFVFGNGGSRAVRIILGLFNLVMGGVALAVGYGTGLLFLVIIGYIIAAMGAVMILLNLFGPGRIYNSRGKDVARPNSDARE
jgi:hypothetical protein